MQLDEHSLAHKIINAPAAGITEKFLMQLVSYMMRQNRAYNVKLDSGLVPKIFNDYKDLKLAEERKKFIENRGKMLSIWFNGMKTRLSEIHLDLQSETLSLEEKTALMLEAMEVDRQVAEISEILGLEYARPRPYKFKRIP